MHSDRPFWHPLAEESLNADGEIEYNCWAVASFHIFAIVKHPENKKLEERIIENTFYN
ncbi:hypothetical protein [uncultured Nostoc sp.]|uniref:hypothetical protein n=1 Tax=uncultured Nostoc sp. TaxID=340711 RepID=UPI0035CBABEF